MTSWYPAARSSSDQELDRGQGGRAPALEGHRGDFGPTVPRRHPGNPAAEADRLRLHRGRAYALPGPCPRSPRTRRARNSGSKPARGLEGGRIRADRYARVRLSRQRRTPACWISTNCSHMRSSAARPTSTSRSARRRSSASTAVSSASTPRPCRRSRPSASPSPSCPSSAPRSSSRRATPTSRTRCTGLGRFRVNAMRQRGSVGLVLRRVQSDTPSFEALGMPPVIRKLAEHERGLVLVTGPTGSGKTTTLGSMIDYINETQHKHIVTIEDPIEILHPDKRVDRQPARGRHRHQGLQRRVEAGAAPGPRRDPRRRDARHRDGQDRADRRGDRSPRVLDVAHDQRDRLDQPDHRLLPAARAAPGAHVARRFPAGDRRASGSSSAGPAAGSRPWRSWWRPAASSTRS